MEVISLGFDYKKLALFFVYILILGVLLTSKTHAATLSNVSDTISTSRPSASAPLATNQAASATQVTILDNESMFLASDSAILWPDAGETLNTVNVASMSAINTPTSGRRIVYFTNTAANTHHAGDVITTAVTAMHKVRFTLQSAIPTDGKVIITFPGSGNNTASPSATTFAFNGLNSTTGLPSQIVANNITCSGDTDTNVTAPVITCKSTGTVSAGTVVTFLIGCTAQSSGECTTSSPRMINPTKTDADDGDDDSWRVTVKTQDNNGVDLDSGEVKISTIEAVQVQATVEASLTFSITGVADATNINTISASCGSIVTNTGIASTATFVNLGLVSNAQVNRAAQQLSVATNAAAGYAITATSSGRFINPSSGQWIAGANGDTALSANDTPVPSTIAAGTAEFGIHSCGARSSVVSDQWTNGGTISTAKFSNPFNSGVNSYYSTIASYSGGPVNSENTVILYAVTASATTPAGIYSNYFTYVATGTF